MPRTKTVQNIREDLQRPKRKKAKNGRRKVTKAQTRRSGRKA